MALGRRAGPGRPPGSEARASAGSTAATRSRSPPSAGWASTTCPARRTGCRLPGWRPRRPSLRKTTRPPDREPPPRCSASSPSSHPSRPGRTSPTSTSSRGCGPRSWRSSRALLIADLLLVHRTAHVISHEGGRHRGGHLDLDRPVVHVRRVGGLGRTGRRRVRLRLPDRAEPQRRQRLRVGDHHELLRGAARVPVPRAVLGRVRCGGPAVHVHLRSASACSTGSSGCCSSSAAS